MYPAHSFFLKMKERGLLKRVFFDALQKYNIYFMELYVLKYYCHCCAPLCWSCVNIHLVFDVEEND